MPSRCSPHPHWKIATCAPSAALIDSRNPMIDLIGTRIVRKANVSRTNASPTTTIRKTGSAPRQLAETSMLDAVVPPTRIVRPGLTLDARAVVAHAIDQVVVAWSFGPVFGMTRITATPFWAATGRHIGDVGYLAQRRDDRGGRAGVADVVGHDQQRAVEAGPEALRRQVVGLARGVRRRLRRPARQAETHAQRRDREHQQHQHADDQHRDAVAHDEASPGRPPRRRRRSAADGGDVARSAGSTAAG